MTMSVIFFSTRFSEVIVLKNDPSEPYGLSVSGKSEQKLADLNSGRMNTELIGLAKHSTRTPSL